LWNNYFDQTINSLYLKFDQNSKEISNSSAIVFERDCCFSAENVFFSSSNVECPISLNLKFLELIKEGFKESKKMNRLTINGGPSLDSPFGFSSIPGKPGEFTKYGRGHLILQNDLAENFMDLLYNSMVIKFKN